MAKISPKIETLLHHLKTQKSFSFIKTLSKEFKDAEVYVVGGTVRDALLGRPTKDYDFVVRGVPITRLEAFLKKQGTVHAVGRRFGVLKFIPKGVKDLEPFDIALPRTEFSVGQSGHYRDFSVQYDAHLSIEDDLSRRDFTINAMALSLSDGWLIDPFGGAGDVRKKVIRTVGRPVLRFGEDYSRMLRALRFACQLGFSLDVATSRAIKKEMKNINNVMDVREEISRGRNENMMRVVPYEIVAREIVKSFVANPVVALDILYAHGVFAELAPELLTMRKCTQPRKWHSEGDVWAHARLALSSLSLPAFKKEFGSDHPDALLIMAILFHDIGKPATKKTPQKDGVDRVRFDGHDRVGADIARVVCERLHISSVEGHPIDIDTLYWLVKHHLILLNSDLSLMKHTTIEKYFLKDIYLGDTLRKLIFCDTLASVRGDGGSSLDAFNILKKRIAAMMINRKKFLPPPIISGDEVMKILNVAQGPVVGEALEHCREEQLAGRVTTKIQARTEIKQWWKQKGK